MLNYKNLYKEKEYELLFKEFYAPLVIFTNQYIRDRETAEDIVQEIFVQIWEKELKFENNLALRTYLYRSAQNRCMNYFRHQKIQVRHEAELAQEQRNAEPDFFNAMVKEEVYRQLSAAIEHLPDQCRKICRLTLEGKKPSEIAEQLNLAVETVKKQKKIALKRIQNQFGRFSLFFILAQIILYTETSALPEGPGEEKKEIRE